MVRTGSVTPARRLPRSPGWPRLSTTRNSRAFEKAVLTRRCSSKRHERHIVAAAHTELGHDLSHEHAVFAERDQTIVGMVSGYTAEAHRRSSGRALKQAAGRSVYRMMAVPLACAPLLRFLGTHADGDFYLQSIAVDSNARGQGVGSTLMAAIEDRARASGSTRICLDVSAKNEGARRLYERRGLTVETVWPRLPFTSPVVVRMSKPL